jgi:hypothetical protein
LSRWALASVELLVPILELVESRVRPVLLEKVVVGTLLDDLALVQHDDAVDFADATARAMAVLCR